MILLGVVAAVLIVGAIALFGGGDEEEVVTQTVTPTAPTPEKAKKEQKKGGEANASKAGGAAAAGGPCGTHGSISNLRASGTGCNEALAVAKQWERRQEECNTIDDPNSPSGYKRTCTVSGYKCTARRDVRSDRRFVGCDRGSARIRFDYNA